MGLLAVISVMSAHLVYHFIPWASSAYLLFLYLLLLPWVCCIIPWASSALLLHLYLSLLLWAYLPSFFPCQPIEFTTLFLKLPRPIYFFFFFTSHYSHELTISFLEYLWPIISSLPLVIVMGLLAINPTTSAFWACFLISLPFCPLFSSHFPYYWASSTVGLFVKNGINTIYIIKQNKDFYTSFQDG